MATRISKDKYNLFANNVVAIDLVDEPTGQGFWSLNAFQLKNLLKETRIDTEGDYHLKLVDSADNIRAFLLDAALNETELEHIGEIINTSSSDPVAVNYSDFIDNDIDIAFLDNHQS